MVDLKDRSVKTIDRDISGKLAHKATVVLEYKYFLP